MNWTEIGKWVLIVLSAVIAAGLVFKFTVKSKSSSVVQKDNIAGGDIVAGNKTTDSHNKR